MTFKQAEAYASKAGFTDNFGKGDSQWFYEMGYVAATIDASDLCTEQEQPGNLKLAIDILKLPAKLETKE